ncbi:ATP-binding cassette sub-family F member 2 [Myotis davidii]|uniref:ATP-binding cassette sub-family F member 2 n=1 Tax=Myotis davidii TaxID=225400 RepID=L5LSN7_MYODS|nr:ATP-binding cassette sub-family F member 2 [Myotis davidii]
MVVGAESLEDEVGWKERHLPSDPEDAPSDQAPLLRVIDVDTERAMLKKKAEQLAHEDAECEELLELYVPPEGPDASKAEKRASRILHALGFTPAMHTRN